MKSRHFGARRAGRALAVFGAAAAALATVVATVLASSFGAATPAIAGTDAAASVAPLADFAECPVDDAVITWGVKESLRSYISGTIAKGAWTVADGAGYETPVFTWSKGAGNFSGADGLLLFAGSVTFTGHGGILNTTLADPQLHFVDASTAYLSFDVTGTTQDGAEVDASDVRFVEVDLAGAALASTGGVASFADAPTTLTAAGAEAFGTYGTGEAFDPVTISFTVAPECSPAAPVVVEPIVEQPPARAGPPIGWIIGGILVAVAAAIALAATLRRRAG